MRGPTGATGPAGDAAVYNTSGTLQTGAKVVIGSGMANAVGTLSVTLTGSAAFTSGTSYQCRAMYESSSPGTLALAINGKTAGSFTIKGDSSKTYEFICVGN